MLVYDGSSHLFLGERKGCPGVWQFPQGGVKKHQTKEEAVVEELHEELGAEPFHFQIVKKLRATHRYDWIEPPSYAKSKWRGQEQSFWLVEFLGDDSDIVLDRFEPEFMNWRWVTSNEVRTLAEPIRQAGYALPLREFDDFLLLKDEGIF